MPIWTLLHPRATQEMLGFIPDFLSDSDPRPAKAQLDANYSHGGGWRPMSKWALRPDGTLQYAPSAPDPEPPLLAIAEARLRDETIRLYESAWVAIIQPDGSFEVSRMD